MNLASNVKDWPERVLCINPDLLSGLHLSCGRELGEDI